MVYPNVEFRVGIISSLRRILPALCRALCSSDNHELHFEAELTSVLCAYTNHMVQILTDSPPIPQFGLRLLVEIMTASIRIETIVATQIAMSGLADVLISMLGESENSSIRVLNDARSSGESGFNETFDPQVPLILRKVFRIKSIVRVHEQSLLLPEYLLRMGLPSKLSEALQRCVLSINGTSDACLSEVSGLSETITLLLDCLKSGIACRSIDLLRPLEDSNRLLFSLVHTCSCMKHKLSPESREPVLHLQFLCCNCLASHFTAFLDSGLKLLMQTKINAAIADSGPVTILRDILLDLSVHKPDNSYHQYLFSTG